MVRCLLAKDREPERDAQPCDKHHKGQAPDASFEMAADGHDLRCYPEPLGAGIFQGPDARCSLPRPSTSPRRGALLATEFRLKFEVPHLFDLGLGTPFGWHRLSPRKESRSLARKCKFQRKHGFILHVRDRQFRDGAGDSGRSRNSVTCNHNRRSHSVRTTAHVSNGISCQLGAEYAPRSAVILDFVVITCLRRCAVAGAQLHQLPMRVDFSN